MIVGVVNANCEATIQLVIGNSGTQRQVIDAVIDTGFTGFLTLPQTIIFALGLTWRGSEEGILGDGSIQIFAVYSAEIIWDGQIRTVKINASDTEPLVGMSLLYGYDLRIQTIEGGMVRIEPLS